MPVRVLGAARGDGAQPGGLLVLVRHRDVRVVRLPPLTAGDVGELARACAGAEVAAEIEEFLVAAADGLPLLVEELFAGLVDARAVAPGCRIALLRIKRARSLVFSAASVSFGKAGRASGVCL